jgi:hypothetical protein
LTSFPFSEFSERGSRSLNSLKGKLVKPARYSRRSPDLGNLGPWAKRAAWHTGF